MLIRDALLYKNDEKTGQFKAESKFYHDLRLNKTTAMPNKLTSIFDRILTNQNLTTILFLNNKCNRAHFM